MASAWLVPTSNLHRSPHSSSLPIRVHVRLRTAATMRLIAAIEDPEVARRILECLKLPARAPPLADATAEPEERVQPAQAWDFDQSRTFDEP